MSRLTDIIDNYAVTQDYRENVLKNFLLMRCKSGAVTFTDNDQEHGEGGLFIFGPDLTFSLSEWCYNPNCLVTSTSFTN